ncbi:MAG: homoserine kinase [Cyanomargarita calcarea GSE-NOS-MK-12-04C]|jgi:homoserine kinase|uniref:Homoserine kinase n=1 Tax=Cyanomargarita calcarea GSE-NOS-MK-12-04C TaxID=2839659 RepID=A0A951QNA2_9CYAN|nr:homoserine kinase [Cyanomargarita calcarea GSE-NOS-MK-12-04C]
MSGNSSVSVTVPATTANLGPGFDCIGAALTLYNNFKFTQIEGEFAISVTGSEAERVQTDESNLVYQAFVKFYQYIEQTPPSVKIEIQMDVPLARGLGSSATAIVGGLVGANQLAGEPLSLSQVMELAIAMEGHPDNVVPALLGGCRLAASGVENEPSRPCWEVCEVPWSADVLLVLAIPDFELSTASARAVLPGEVSRGDAIFNAAHLGLLLRGLETGKPDWLRAGLQDKLHQSYRKSLIKGYDAVNSAALEAGAYGMVISGAGPTLLALTDTVNSEAVAIAMKDAWQKQGVNPQVRSLCLDTQGARIMSGKVIC